MTFTVYHMTREHFGDLSRLGYSDTLPPTLFGYAAVARVDVSCLGETFQVTNHGVPGGPDNWLTGAAVVWTPMRPQDVRSTSVGDLMKDDATGLFYQCRGCGWSDGFTL